jgi:hypothetical protein
VLDLTGREAHDATSVEEDQDAGDRREKMRVDAEDVRP